MPGPVFDLRSVLRLTLPVALLLGFHARAAFAQG